ncbi:hypothetical protein HELRODRAFT_184175 [Helobdella robusta]|uniref:Uncharacterized protein n=1 Tax=Helobdella robusta TaxID=6412 RepID=T1FKQ1_HELRO|nr:hypothetical protein HELRODRAFT_184175 [Helobdella robusta]ESO06751.1 hypothetical protein HELRODRAFT_184175 [Helobdella robusta]
MTWLGLMPACRLGWYLSKDLMKEVHPVPVQIYDWDKTKSGKYACLDNHRTLLLIMANRPVTIKVSSRTINCSVDVYYHEFNSAHKLWLFSVNEDTGETKLMNSGDHVVKNSRRVVFVSVFFRGII